MTFTLPSDGEVLLTRVFDAPRRLVWDAWTKPELFKRWHAPRAVEIPFCELDPRPGGVLHFCHQIGKAEQLWAKGAFREVVAPRRLVYTLAFVDTEGRPTSPRIMPGWPVTAVFTNTVTLEEQAGQTTLTVHQIITPPEAAASFAVKEALSSAHRGWGETLDRLTELMAAAPR